MSLARTRLKILQKIAQAVPGSPPSPMPAGDPASPASPASPTSPNAPTVPGTPQNTTVPVDPSPPASQLYPTLRVGFDANRVGIIDALVKQLSSATNVATDGKYNLQQLRNNNFQFDPSQFSSPDQKNIMNLFNKVYKTLLNSGQTFNQAVSAQQLSNYVAIILQSPELANLSQVNPTGQIAQKQPIPGNFKDTIRELVARLQPTVPTRRA